MDPAAGEDGFSPMKTAKAGRRAGKRVAITEPTSASGDGRNVPNEQVSFNGGSSQPPAQYQQQLSSQPSQSQHAAQYSSPEQQQYSQQQQPQQPTAAASTPAGPPPKKVGFDLQASDGDSSGQQQRFTGVSRRKQEQLQREETTEAKHRNKYDEKAIDGVADIPELEEEGWEDITKVVAQAPRAAAPKVQVISELEQDQGWLRVKPSNEDIDLSLLTGYLLPSEQVGWFAGLLQAN
eukprot:GHRR01026876.1.p1 GENE.GHRR01026876.1~~GHRR01026876.1.p1  ORF type:complete len:236 (+),score=111.58 GHRR01026876.1:733-1440(+)